RQLVPRTHLPREADVIAHVALGFRAGPRRIRREDERRLILLVERIRADLLVAPVAVGGPEPQAVLLDRPAERGAHVVDLQDAVGRKDALIDQRLVDVVALKLVVREIRERGPAEAVAA